MNAQVQVLLDSFDVKQPWDITVAHAVNNQKRLRQFIQSDVTVLIEGDISVSKGEQEIIMAHPPIDTSDLTFREWIHHINDSKNGAKLDFKNPEAVREALKVLGSLNIKIPIFLHADVVKGPGGVAHVFNASTFIEECTSYYLKGVLSLGWTMEYVSDYSGYTKKSLKEMTNIVKSINDEQVTTICIRACYLKQMPQTFFDEFRQNSNVFFTLWNALKDPLLPEDLKQWVEKSIGLDQVFYVLQDRNGKSIQL